MSVETTAGAAARIPRASLFGIGRYYVAGEAVDVPVSWDDLRRDTAWAAGMLRAHGVGRGTAVVVVSNGNEMLWKTAFEEAILELGGTWCAADQWPFDSSRTASFANRLQPDLVLNLGPDVAGELAKGTGGLAAQLGSVRAVLAQPDAVPLLHAASVPAFLFAKLGPAVAVECVQRTGAHVNAAEWRVSVERGELRVTSVGARAHASEQAHTGVNGQLVDGACACGSTDPRVALTTGSE